MIALSDIEVMRRRAGIVTRRHPLASAYPSEPEMLSEVDDLPFMFEFYGYETPLRAWLECLYVTGFAHGHALRIRIRDASPQAIDRNNEDAVIEACLVRGWVKPVAFSPREAWSVNTLATVNWSGWTFEPSGDLGAWLEGGPLPAVGCPLKQAEYDGRGAKRKAA